MTSRNNINAPTATDIISRPWKTQFNDMIGGYCITLKDDKRRPSEGAVCFADYTSEVIANHMVKVHNAWVEQKQGPKRDNGRVMPQDLEPEHEHEMHNGKCIICGWEEP